MLFNSYRFMVFFPVILILYFVVPKKLRCPLLLVASYYFYMCWNAKYLILILLSTIVTYLAGILIETTKYKKASLIGSFIVNLAILGFFKYFNFLLSSINSVLESFHHGMISNPFDFILPVGISFYTFQALGYTIDVYRGEIAAERRFFRYALFISFFPQLVAGPIERSKSLLSQFNRLEEIQVWNFARIRSGAFMMLWGYFLKMMIADRLSHLVNHVYAQYTMYGTCILALGSIAFSLQIYCDFASYSMIAIGAAKIMGITLMENFDTPYFAMSIREFWRRWHISLSTWFRDYVYIPLGGNRKGPVRRKWNVLLTFLLSGLWHGANWTFLFWGFLHGIYQVAGDLTAPVRKKLNDFFHTNTEAFSYRLIRMAGTYFLTLIAWIFFRSDSIRDGFSYIGRMFTKWDPWTLVDSTLFTLSLSRLEMFILFLCILLLFLVSYIQYTKKMRFDEFICAQNGWFQVLVFYVLVMAIAIFGQYGSFDTNAFIYFQF